MFQTVVNRTVRFAPHCLYSDGSDDTYVVTLPAVSIRCSDKSMMYGFSKVLL